MSYINKDGQFTTRRPKKTYLKPAEAIAKANTIAKEADKKIAEVIAGAEKIIANVTAEVTAEADKRVTEAIAQRDHWELVAGEFAAENEQLRRKVQRLEAELREVRSDPSVAPKAGKKIKKRVKKGPEWDEFDG